MSGKVAVLAAALLLGACSSGSRDPVNSDDKPKPGDGRPKPVPDDGGGEEPGTDGGSEEPLSISLEFESIALEGSPRAITDFAFVPGTMELLVLEKGLGKDVKGARILHYELAGDAAELRGTFELPSSYDYHDCGLLSIAFDPDYAKNGFVYFAYCDSYDYSSVSRHVFDPDDYTKIASSAALVLRVGEDGAPNAWHNVGDIGFDHDGNLWALFGEKNDSDRAQDLSEALGSVVRVRPRRGSGEEGYTVVEDNPFAALSEANADIVAYGLRSPWRGALDSRGRLWIGDVGDTDFEEVNVLEAFDGANFGWPLASGQCKKDCKGLTDPLISWNHDLDTWAAQEDPDAEPTTRRVSWVGVEYVAGDNDRYEGRLDGRMLYGDFCGGWVRAIELDAMGNVRFDGHAGHLPTASAWAQGPDGYVYATTYGNCQTGPYQPGRLVRAVLAK